MVDGVICTRGLGFFCIITVTRVADKLNDEGIIILVIVKAIDSIYAKQRITDFLLYSINTQSKIKHVYGFLLHIYTRIS